MAEQDRLAALLERATRERRGEAEEQAVRRDGSGVSGDEAGAVGDVPAADEVAVSGGEWLPPDPGRHRLERRRPALVTVPQSLRSLNLSVRPVAVVALLVVALVAAGIFGLRWWRAEQGSTPVPVAPLASELSAAPGGGDGVAATAVGPGETAAQARAAGGSVPGGSGSADPPVSSTAAPAELVVHVAGEVRHAGVVRLGPGARVQDAVDAAGGLSDGADTSRLNLARTVNDGERIWVPSPGEEVPEVPDPAGTGPSGSSGGPSGPADDGSGAVQQINLNTADQAVLEELPGVGPVTAGAIVAWREENGGFSTPDELLEVSGIGESTLDKLRPHVTL